MKDTWYADNRDLVKWGTLAHVAQREALDLIVQVPYLRSGKKALLHTGKETIELPPSVWSFFRNVSAVSSLGKSLGLDIVVISEEFEPQRRAAYCRALIDRISNLSQSKVVLLDPDTGLAPATPRAEHVTASEVEVVWDALREGDWLILYQHAWRDRNWKDDARLKFAAACGVECEMFTAPDIASDVAFFAAKKVSMG